MTVPASPATYASGILIFRLWQFAGMTFFKISRFYPRSRYAGLLFRNEFFGEARIRNIPEMNYVFDSSELPELEEKLETNLIPRLQYVRESAEKQSR